jgi:hypothetical protein
MHAPSSTKVYDMPGHMSPVVITRILFYQSKCCFCSSCQRGYVCDVTGCAQCRFRAKGACQRGAIHHDRPRRERVYDIGGGNAGNIVIVRLIMQAIPNVSPQHFHSIRPKIVNYQNSYKQSTLYHRVQLSSWYCIT